MKICKQVNNLSNKTMSRFYFHFKKYCEASLYFLINSFCWNKRFGKCIILHTFFNLKIHLSWLINSNGMSTYLEVFYCFHCLHIHFLYSCFLRGYFFCIWSYQIGMIFNWIYLICTCNPNSFYHFESEWTWE